MVVYILIFIAKLVEVSLSTVRNVLINRGEKGKAALIGFVEALIWVLVVANVISSITEDPIKVVVYCVAFALGNYLGVILEGKLAIGTACIQAVVGQDEKETVSASMRDMGFGVTTVRGEGKDGPVNVLMIYLKRKCVEEAIAIIKSDCPQALVTVNDVRHLRNGFLKK